MKIDRINRIHELLKSVHNISINDLCDTFQVSKNTIRREIAELEQQGLIKKVYGGIVLAEPSGSPEPFASRESRNADAKKQIARMAADFVHDGDVIYIDSGTTTMHMIPYLTEKHRLTIVTASVHVINAASNYSNLNVLVEKDCEHFLLVDDSKFDISSLMSYCTLKEMQYIMTNKLPPEKYVSYCTANHIQLITPDTIREEEVEKIATMR